MWTLIGPFNEQVVVRDGAAGTHAAVEDFFMFSAVVTHINDPDISGGRARRAAIECFKLVRDAGMAQFIAHRLPCARFWRCALL